MVLPLSVSREQSMSAPDPQALPPTPPSPPANLDTLALFNEAQRRLKSEQETASCWKCLSHGNKNFTGEGGTRAVFNVYF